MCSTQGKYSSSLLGRSVKTTTPPPTTTTKKQVINMQSWKIWIICISDRRHVSSFNDVDSFSRSRDRAERTNKNNKK